MAGLGALYDFLGRGFSVMRPMGSAQEFLDLFLNQEQAIMDKHLRNHPHPSTDLRGVAAPCFSGFPSCVRATESPQSGPLRLLPDAGMTTPHDNDTTHFGYKTVRTAEKAEKVAEVFHSVAAKYDLMNDLMSFRHPSPLEAFHHHVVRRAPRHAVLDIAGGTGDLARAFARETGPSGRVVLADINASMLNVGRDKLLDNGFSGVEYVQANAECLPFADNTFDVITIAFGLRNVTDKDAALRSMYRVLKPGGRLLVLEFSKPLYGPLSKLYDAYSFSLLPAMGQLVTQDAESYRYLAESIRMHPDQETLKGMMAAAGFVNCDYHNLTGGIVALHRGFK